MWKIILGLSFVVFDNILVSETFQYLMQEDKETTANSTIRVTTIVDNEMQEEDEVLASNSTTFVSSNNDDKLILGISLAITAFLTLILGFVLYFVIKKWKKASNLDSKQQHEQNKTILPSLSSSVSSLATLSSQLALGQPIMLNELNSTSKERPYLDIDENNLLANNSLDHISLGLDDSHDKLPSYNNLFTNYIIFKNTLKL